MRIADIIIGDRARVSAGWLDDLERSIERHGVLHPIGVTQDNVLVFGFRRLMACKNLGMTEIPATVIHIDPDDPATALRLEQTENNIRRDFTPEEKVEIARKIEEALAGRHGGDRKSSDNTLPLEIGKSSDLAAASVGMSGEQYRRIKVVMDSGNQEIIDKMNSGELSVRAAYMAVKGKKVETKQLDAKAEASAEPQKKVERFKIVLKFKNPESDARRIVESNGEYADALLVEIAKLRGHSLEKIKH